MGRIKEEPFVKSSGTLEQRTLLTPCPVCDAESGIFCTRENGQFYPEHKFHTIRIIQAEMGNTDKGEISTFRGTQLDGRLFYCSTQMFKYENGQLRQTVSQHRVLANSMEEAKGLAFEQALKMKPTFSVGEILVMPHSDNEATLNDTTRPA